MKLLCIIFGFIYLTNSFRMNTLSEKYDVRQLVEEMFDLKFSSRFKIKSFGEAPKHMMDIYRNLERSGKSSGEIVRNIYPIKDMHAEDISTKELLLFNVSCFNALEDIKTAHLYLHRRRTVRPHVTYKSAKPNSRLLAPPIRVRIGSIFYGKNDRTKITTLASIPVIQTTKGGWNSIDITSPLRELLLNLPQIKNNNITLSVRFDAPHGHKIHPIKFLKYQHKNTITAFIVTFSQNELKPKRTSKLYRKLHGKMRDNDMFGTLDGQRKIKNHKDLFEMQDFKSKRSVDDNELFGFVENRTEIYPTFGVGDFRKRRRRNHRRRVPRVDTSIVWNQVKENIFENSVDLLPDIKCGIEPVSINLTDIGLSHLIYEPKILIGDYCRGTCMSSSYQDSNDDFLSAQELDLVSISNKINPSCIPINYKSVNLLYIDNYGNIVLRNYPKMIVTECLCQLN